MNMPHRPAAIAFAFAGLLLTATLNGAGQPEPQKDPKQVDAKKDVDPKKGFDPKKGPPTVVSRVESAAKHPILTGVAADFHSKGSLYRNASLAKSAAILRAVRESGPRERLAAFRMTGPGIPRQGNPVVGGGEVTSGTLSPCLGVGIGMAYVAAGRAEPGTELAIDVRGKIREAVVAAKPLYRKEDDG